MQLSYVATLGRLRAATRRRGHELLTDVHCSSMITLGHIWQLRLGNSWRIFGERLDHPPCSPDSVWCGWAELSSSTIGRSKGQGQPNSRFSGDY